MKRSILVVWLLCCLGLMAGSKKDDKLVVQFNLEGASSDGPKMSVPQQVAGAQVYFRLSPEIATNDIESFRPFPADDGVSYGILFKLNRTGTQRLAATTNANQGKLLLGRINGATRDVLRIDRSIDDGVIVIWSNVTAREIGLLDQMIPRVGQTMQEWKKQKKK